MERVQSDRKMRPKRSRTLNAAIDAVEDCSSVHQGGATAWPREGERIGWGWGRRVAVPPAPYSNERGLANDAEAYRRPTVGLRIPSRSRYAAKGDRWTVSCRMSTMRLRLVWMGDAAAFGAPGCAEDAMVGTRAHESR